MNDPIDPKTKVAGEKKPGKFHYNPVNMSGKHEELGEDADKIPPDKESKSREEMEKQDERR